MLSRSSLFSVHIRHTADCWDFIPTASECNFFKQNMYNKHLPRHEVFFLFSFFCFQVKRGMLQDISQVLSKEKTMRSVEKHFYLVLNWPSTGRPGESGLWRGLSPCWTQKKKVWSSLGRNERREHRHPCLTSLTPRRIKVVSALLSLRTY
jgi:hypothetical protein